MKKNRFWVTRKYIFMYFIFLYIFFKQDIFFYTTKQQSEKEETSTNAQRVHEQRAHEFCDAGRVSAQCNLVSAREISNGRCASAKLESRRFCRIELELLGGKNDHFAVGRWVALPAPHPVPPMPRFQKTAIRFGSKQIKTDPNKDPLGPSAESLKSVFIKHIYKTVYKTCTCIKRPHKLYKTPLNWSLSHKKKTPTDNRPFNENIVCYYYFYYYYLRVNHFTVKNSLWFCMLCRKTATAKSTKLHTMCKSNEFLSKLSCEVCSGFKTVMVSKMCCSTCCLDTFSAWFVFIFASSNHTATHNTEDDNNKHVVNRSETMTLRKEGEGQDFKKTKQKKTHNVSFILFVNTLYNKKSFF